MKSKKLDAVQVWKDFEDVLVPRLRLSVIDRAVYSHLFRHSRLEGKLRIRFTLAWLARGIRLCAASARESVRRLIELGALHLVERTTVGHVVEVRLPEEIRPAPRDTIETGNRSSENGLQPVNLEEASFLQDKALRQAIHARERGRCEGVVEEEVFRKRAESGVASLSMVRIINRWWGSVWTSAQNNLRAPKTGVKWLPF